MHSVQSEIKTIVEEIKPEVERVFQHLHANPEISWKEVKTTQYLKEKLENYGFEVQTFDDITGLVVTYGSGDLCIGLRGDIDALWQEVDGVFQANHSCGHDAHATMAFGALIALKKLGIPNYVKLKVFFQPAEEVGKGALAFIDKGLLDDIDYLYGVHLRSIQEMGDGYAAPAIMHGSAKVLKGSIRGNDAHGSRPNQGQNAIEVMSLLVHAIQSIKLDPLTPHSAKVTMFKAGGESANIIPGNGIFSIDLRAQTNELMDTLLEQVTNSIDYVAKFLNVEITFDITSEIAAAKVDEKAVNLMAQAISDTVGEEFLIPAIVSPGGEDFHYYTLKRPSVKATMLGLGCDLAPGLHHPKMKFNHDRIITGVEILARTVIRTYESLEDK
ncbi:M20 peptidase aminoacylase family protein [Ureibacillus manganicus]|uniref:M20 peptidase aminoacylase family protein n=1 Tax=Ureibacillus manganicus TaxID=1266064 RepID=UPI000ADD4FCE|nr:M20 peptidase aminoacylase family protein [Ureibacillus manganicus]